MKIFLKYVLILILSAQIFACSSKKGQLIKIDEVSPWCIVGFDVLNRSPEQRITMLKELGLQRYGLIEVKVSSMK